MGATLYYEYYPRKCNDKEILPFLDVSENEINGKYISYEFYITCRELANYDKDNGCYIFDDTTKLFDFASRKTVPSEISDYIAECYRDDIPMFIIWLR